MTSDQNEAFRQMIARKRHDLGTCELYILAPGFGEDVTVDGVPIYGSIAIGVADYPDGSCIVMTRKTWEQNLAILAPLLGEALCDDAQKYLAVSQ